MNVSGARRTKLPAKKLIPARTKGSKSSQRPHPPTQHIKHRIVPQGKPGEAYAKLNVLRG